jgi:ABC-type molybdate transport system substrate-binding protein
MSERYVIQVLSADAPKAGLRKGAAAFSAETGQPHEIELATGPIIKERVASGRANADLIVIPLAELDDLARAGHIDPRSVRPIGAVTVGVTIRNGAREPDISSVEAFIQSVLAADRLIYNTASSGQYIAKMFETLRLADKITEKSLILPTGKAVMEQLAADESGTAIGFGHVTEILLHNDLGTRLVGPLPGAIGRDTIYALGLLRDASQRDTAGRLADFLTSRTGKQIFVDTGVL